ncbi:MAG: glycosyltransferase family 4 protein, partial [Dethiobacteria bacterium]|nr:glycosyltransferase family 4 protein [Dethiobacteria bacterium]
IAGSNPGNEIKSLVSSYKNIELIDTPGDMKPYFENASVYLAPIFSGAGMKVKVAEALSFGLPIVGTNHAFNGYRITDRRDGYRANDAAEFIESLEHYASLPAEAKKSFRVNAYNIFHDYHSIEASTKCFQRIISSLEQS